MTVAMRLNDDERAMLAGERGEAVRRALQLQMTVGDFFGAEDFVPIDSAHMMAEIESMGEPCLAWVEEMASADMGAAGGLGCGLHAARINSRSRSAPNGMRQWFMAFLSGCQFGI